MVESVTEENFDRILDKFVERLKEAPVQSGKVMWLELQLDEFLENDFFGTEGQCDPRGDHRDDD